MHDKKIATGAKAQVYERQKLLDGTEKEVADFNVSAEYRLIKLQAAFKGVHAGLLRGFSHFLETKALELPFFSSSFSFARVRFMKLKHVELTQLMRGSLSFVVGLNLRY